MWHLFPVLAMALLVGCASPQSILKSEGKGTKWTYSASMEKTWTAAANAARSGELRIQSMNHERGLIQASTPTRLESWGEVVAIWVRSVNATNTEVEVVSKPQGPTGLFRYDWDQPILKNIAAQLELPPPVFPPKAIAASPKGK